MLFLFSLLLELLLFADHTSAPQFLFLFLDTAERVPLLSSNCAGKSDISATVLTVLIVPRSEQRTYRHFQLVLCLERLSHQLDGFSRSLVSGPRLRRVTKENAGVPRYFVSSLADPI